MYAPVKNERGVALIIAIIFLLVLSLLVAVLNRAAIFEMFSSQHYQASQQAFDAAETGIRRGLAWLTAQGVAPENQLNPPAWFSNSTTSTVPPASSGWSNYSSAGSSASCRYYMQHLKDESMAYTGGESAKIGTSTTAGLKVHYYRITSEGVTSGGQGKKQLQLVTTARY